MALNPKQIKELRDFIKQNKDTARDKIAAQKDKTDILGVIIAIFDDIEKLAKKSQANDHLKSFKSYFVSTKEKLDANPFAKGMLYAALTADSIKGDLNKALKAANNVDANDANLSLWKELAIWLHGLYQFTAKKVPAEQQTLYLKNPATFVYTTDELGDGPVYNKTGITAFHIANYYEEMAKTMETLVKQFEDKKAAPLKPEVPALPPAPTPEPIVPSPAIPAAPLNTTTTTIPAPTTPPVPKEIDKPITDTGFQQRDITINGMSIHLEMQQGKDTLTIRLLHDEQKLAALMTFLQNGMQMPQIAPLPIEKKEEKPKSVIDYLLKHPQIEQEDMVRSLREAIEFFQFTSLEEGILKAHIKESIGYIKRYANESRYYFWSKAHADFVDKAAKDIQEEPVIKNKVTKFLDYYSEAFSIGGNTSKDAFKVAIVLIYNRLIGSPLKEEDVVQVSKSLV